MHCKLGSVEKAKNIFEDQDPSFKSYYETLCSVDESWMSEVALSFPVPSVY
jgi:hypothetical protein